jgi:hypothetical protein
MVATFGGVFLLPPEWRWGDVDEHHRPTSAVEL